MRRSRAVTWDQLRVGILLLVGLAILAMGTFYIGQVGHVFGRRYELVTLMRSAEGLVPGAAVQLAGQNVGQVDRVEWLAPAQRARTGEAVAVWLAVNREVQEQIRADSKAEVRTQGLLGDRVIDIVPGSEGSPILEQGDTLAAAEPLDYQAILRKGSDAVTGLGDLAARLDSITRELLAGHGSLGRMLVDDSLYGNVSRLSLSLDRFLRRVNAGQGALGQLLTDSTLYGNLVGLTAGLDTLTSRVASGQGTLGRMVASDSLYAELHGAAARANELLGKLVRGEGSMGRAVVSDSLYEEVLKSLVDLNAMLADVREHPKKYIPPVKVF
ncbi:MAG: MlaD family protein [Candidatus Palauibacterales bacterium]|nr:MlaD family protein [Candidatus Palauibacterales bacterium]MDP2584599.1 MlaD family protein [Candidatus Palauibacterales bacterium]